MCEIIQASVRLLVHSGSLMQLSLCKSEEITDIGVAFYCTLNHKLGGRLEGFQGGITA